ncbi:MAG TPA: sensor domain-containing diguanylate cyclase [Bacillus bacterium]|nr:sensor domain-containing diguanylate cyclase [Bacillus sp. (in: firmicutes)]
MPKENCMLINNVTKLKSYFFDLIIDEEHSANLPQLNQKLVQFLKDMTSVNIVRLYLYNKWKECYFLEQSTDFVTKNSSYYSLPKERIVETQLVKTVADDVLSADSIWGNDGNETAYIVLLNNHGKLRSKFGFLYFELSDSIQEEVASTLTDFLKFVGIETSRLMESSKRYFGYLNEEVRYEQLYRVTSKFHSSMNMDDVLAEVIHTLQEVYASFDCVLLLSHDTTCDQSLPIRDLEYGSESVNHAAVQAYLTGNVQFEDSMIDGRSVLYAPLKGKQGIYGVLQVTAPNTLVFPKQEVGFIELLANTAGSALENAQLYQQSRKLISDLQLINKTSHRLNTNLRLTDTINFMTDQIKASFDAGEVGFILFHGKEQFEVLMGSTEYFFSDEVEDLFKYINKKIKVEKDAIFIGDLSLDENSKVGKLRSLMVIPMIQSNMLIGAVYVLHENPYHFSFDKFKLLQSLIHHSTLAFTNSMLREELEKMVITDHLTKLYSRNYLDERIHLSMNTDALGAFLLIDIDDFKSINDTYGHQIGDEVIIQVANIIKRSIREHDIGARWGGEELAIYLPKADLKTGLMVAKRLVERVEAETNPKITISCGITVWNKENNDSVKKLFNRADEALYKAKQTGKNRVIIYEENNQ